MEADAHGARRTAEERRDLLAGQPVHVVHEHDLALTYRRIGERLVRDRQYEEGLRSLDDGHKLIQKLADANPEAARYTPSPIL